MKTFHLRWRALIGIALACMLVSACSDTTAADTPAPSNPGQRAGTTPKKADDPNPAAKAQSKTSNVKKEPATGKSRPHPFVPADYVRSRKGLAATSIGALELKAVIIGPVRKAVIQEGNMPHIVKEGDLIGNLKVLTIRDDEVVLGDGRRKQILALYEY